jgi:hypothetical protein
VLLGNLTLAHWSRQERIADQEAWSFIKAHHWIGRIIWQRIERQDLFEMCQEGSVNTTNAPGVFAMRL